MIFTFDHVLFLPEKIILEITFPQDIIIKNSLDVTTLAIRDMSETMRLTFQENTNSVIIYNATDKYYQPNTKHIFSIKNLKNPVSFNIISEFL